MWIPITLAAATFQILRTSRQHVLRHTLTVNGAGFVRYGYGFPLAVLVAMVTFGLVGEPVPDAPWRFWPIIAGAGIAQILGTLALIRAFDLRDFVIGTVYSKTEVIIVALVSTIVLGEALRPLGWASAAVCMVGIAWLAAPRRVRDLLSSAADPAALMGVLAATGLATAAVGIRAASNSLGDDPVWNRALFTLAVMLGIQTLINGAQLVITDRPELGNVARQWRAALPVGVLSLCGSAGWALAVTLTNAAKVRTLGQVEIVLAFAISALWLHEQHTRAEYAASALVLVGVVGVVVFGSTIAGPGYSSAVRGLEIPELEEDFAADPVELFFDLAYVFAFSQLVALILHDATWHGIGEAGLLLLLLWLPWSQFTWSANAVSGNSRRARVLFLLATTASVPMAASITTALGDGGLLFALPLASIFLVAVLAMMVLSLDSDSNERRSALRYSAPSACAMALIVLGAFFHGDARVVIWIAGALTFIGATLVAGTGEWIIRTGHFAERHGLIIIIALGEVIVALGNSVVIPLAREEGVPGATAATLVGAGILAGLLWWSYFDRVQPALEHRAEHFEGIELGRFVRDVYTYAHFPLVAGIVLTAVALEEMTLHPSEPLSLTFRMIGAGGLVLFFGGSGIAVYRAFGVVANERVVAVVVIVAMSFLLADVDAIVLFVAVDVVLFAALTVEHLRIERPGVVEAESSVDDRQVGNERPA